MFTKTTQKSVSLLCLTGLVIAGCSKAPHRSATQPELPTLQVRVQPVGTKNVTLTEELVGTVRAKTHATLEAKVSGRIDQMPVVLGQKVTAGQLVAHLDAGEIKARLEQAQATLEQADRDWARISKLFGGQAITKAEYDAAESRQHVAQAGVAEAKAMMGYVEVLAPFGGVVSRKMAEAGDLATPGKPLVEIEDPSVLQLEADVPESLGSRVQPGGRLSVRLDDASQPLCGTISEVAPAADPVSRTFRVKLDLPAAPGLRPGRFARLAVPLGEHQSLSIPASAVVRRGQLELVFVIVNQHAQLHLVKTGKLSDKEVEILSGLDPGDSVAVADAALLNDGQPVEVK